MPAPTAWGAGQEASLPVSSSEKGNSAVKRLPIGVTQLPLGTQHGARSRSWRNGRRRRSPRGRPGQPPSGDGHGEACLRARPSCRRQAVPAGDLVPEPRSANNPHATQQLPHGTRALRWPCAPRRTPVGTPSGQRLGHGPAGQRADPELRTCVDVSLSRLFHLLILETKQKPSELPPAGGHPAGRPEARTHLIAAVGHSDNGHIVSNFSASREQGLLLCLIVQRASLRHTQLP